MQRKRPPLTAEERSVLLLAGAGYTDEEAAAQIGITPNQARYRMRILCLKLGAKNRTHAVVIALRHRTIRLGVFRSVSKSNVFVAL